MMEVYIITGASKGIGLALTEVLAEKGHKVFGIARSFPENWAGAKSFVFDLVDSGNIPALITEIIKEIPEDCTRLILINNAGTVAPIGFAGTYTAEQISRSIALNLTAPMIMSSAFIAESETIQADRAIINISSGAGRKPYEGWSAYCAGKAGLDHFSLVLDKEYKEIKVLSIAPGIIDTDMQGEIRESSQSDFPLIDNFISYKEQGMLSSPEETARKLTGLMERRDFLELETLADIRNFD